MKQCLEKGKNPSLGGDRLQAFTQNILFKFGAKQLIGKDPEFRATVEKAPRIARCDAPVLIYGETGTGKELLARAVHYFSRRSQKPFIPINCASIPPQLFENELFGHVKGAFTGALLRHDGLVRTADSGTLFLDEIDSIPTSVQANLLRFLEEKEIKPLGSNRILKVDVRIIAATRSELSEKVESGDFRDDLLYRLNVLSITVPPLRKRKCDIPLLANYFLRKYAQMFSKPDVRFKPETLALLTRYDWPGNIRELENIIQQAAVLCENNVIGAESLQLPEKFVRCQPKRLKSFKEEKERVVHDFEKNYICDMLAAHGGNVTRAATAAQKHRRAFWALVKKYNINPNDYRIS